MERGERMKRREEGENGEGRERMKRREEGENKEEREGRE
jgi:hypothetical protein